MPRPCSAYRGRDRFRLDEASRWSRAGFAFRPPGRGLGMLVYDGESAHLLGRHVEACVAHPERTADPFVHEILEFLPGHFLDDGAQDVGVDPVAETLTRLVRQRKFGRPHHEFGHRCGLENVRAVVDLVQRTGSKSVDETGRVREQVFDCDRRAGGHDNRSGSGPSLEHLHTLEGREVLRHRIVQLDPALFVQRHDGHTGDDLGHRVDAEDRVLLHRHLPGDVTLTPGAPRDNAALACQEHDDASVLTLVHETLHPRIEPRQPFFTEADRCRRCSGERLAGLTGRLGVAGRMNCERKKKDDRNAAEAAQPGGHLIIPQSHRGCPDYGVDAARASNVTRLLRRPIHRVCPDKLDLSSPWAGEFGLPAEALQPVTDSPPPPRLRRATFAWVMREGWRRRPDLNRGWRFADRTGLPLVAPGFVFWS